mgnify:CR=1 FL=1
MTYLSVIVSLTSESESGLKKLIREVVKDISLTAIDGLVYVAIGISIYRFIHVI